MNSIRILGFVACLMTTATVSAAEGNSDAGLFAKGQRQFTVSGGSGNAFDESYFVIGAGIGYYVVDGFNVGLQLEAWTGGDPSIYKMTPSVQYVFYRVPRITPYVGAFYRFNEIEDLPSIDSAGARAGIYLRMGSNGHVGLGAVYESYLDCDTRSYVTCEDETYPEISFTFAF